VSDKLRSRLFEAEAATKHIPAIAKEGAVMDKRLPVFYYVVAFAMLGMSVFHFFNSDDRSLDTMRMPRMDATPIVNDGDYEPRYNPALNLIGGICALFLFGYLYWACYRKFKKDSKAELVASENSLYDISLATGQNEYDLFYKSAEKWSVSGDKIEEDFKRYMAEQVLPYYAQDFVRKNKAHIDESLVIKKEVKPTSWSDWAIALLVFPGSLLLLLAIMAFFE
jgi:hypothetical protein